VHIAITDSGLGGLTICAGIEQWLRQGGRLGVRLTYVNAWPDEGRGYNDLPDLAARAAVFGRALRRIDEMRPDLVVIACNTLSIVYEHTEYIGPMHARVQGILDAGVDLFVEALTGQPGSALVLVGTRTTIEAGAHRERLLARGIGPDRVAGASCHGLATAIERGPHSLATAALIDACAERVAAGRPAGDPLLVGLCCTHYGMVGERLRVAVRTQTGGTVETLDPNARLVTGVVSSLPAQGDGEDARDGRPAAPPLVRVLSKVGLRDEQRQAVGSILERVSPATAEALRAYVHVPDLFLTRGLGCLARIRGGAGPVGG
jgi:glutamate racemase